MTCFFCKGELRESVTTDVTDYDDCIIVVRGVPCRKCTQCGEIVINLQVGERIEQIVDGLKESMQEVAIVRYSNPAA
ncbi:MAG: type II toxin-antitoxin system MqsA family antitoxin [Defluviitaleaceae bacterium]|nr:type II toxin-antitoxin system MqsA family antitoxin [Defluviitaleaceae bacterium]MCL2273582.1 type II toxin-antitoxin system MqsA family antitoxin [Defluviitaleaceae bacterium]